MTKVPFNAKVDLSGDVIDNTSNVEKAVNMYLNNFEHYSIVPGFESIFTKSYGSSDGIDGMYWWEEKDLFIYVHAGDIYKFDFESQVSTDITGDGLLTGYPVSFATDGDRLYLSNRGRMVYTDGSANTQYIDNENCPTNISHVIFLDQYIVVLNADTGRFHWSNVGDGLTWDAIDLASAEGGPDKILSILTFNRQLYLFGENTIERWYTKKVSDGGIPFIRSDSFFIQVGVASPYSSCIANGQVFWMNANRQLMTFSESSVNILSLPFKEDLLDIDNFEDLKMFEHTCGGVGYIVCVFTRSNKTFAYNYLTKSWTQFGSWNADIGDFEAHQMNNSVYIPTENYTVIGSIDTDKIYKISKDIQDFDGDLIRFVLRTGHNDYGTLNRKQAVKVAFSVKKGYDDDADTESLLLLRFKKDNRDWTNPIELSLGKRGDTRNIVNYNGSHMFTTIQYEISGQITSSFILKGIDTDIWELN